MRVRRLCRATALDDRAGNTRPRGIRATLLRSGFSADARCAEPSIRCVPPSRWTLQPHRKTPRALQAPHFAGVNIVTLAEGDITHLHIGQGHLKPIRIWLRITRRGLRGRTTEKAVSATASRRQGSTPERSRQATGKQPPRPLSWNVRSASSLQACRQKNRET